MLDFPNHVGYLKRTNIYHNTAQDATQTDTGPTNLRHVVVISKCTTNHSHFREIDEAIVSEVGRSFFYERQVSEIHAEVRDAGWVTSVSRNRILLEDRPSHPFIRIAIATCNNTRH